jgi:hypothetical protein
MNWEKSYSANYFQNNKCDASESDLIAYKLNVYNSNPAEGQWDFSIQNLVWNSIQAP